MCSNGRGPYSYPHGSRGCPHTSLSLEKEEIVWAAAENGVLWSGAPRITSYNYYYLHYYMYVTVAANPKLVNIN